MVGPAKLKFLWDEIAFLNKQSVDGAIVECGVWAGGATLTMVYAQLHTGSTSRSFWLFDTFQGLPPPSHPRDDPRAKHVYSKISQGDGQSYGYKKTIGGRWNYAPLQLVQAVLDLSGYPSTRLHFVKGPVETTLSSSYLPEKIALLRLDTDWYTSTSKELDILWDRLLPGGILVIDDYCAWSGAKNAADDFFRRRRANLSRMVVPHGNDSLCLTLRKPG